MAICTIEVLVGVTPTPVPRIVGATGFEILNLGPNDIWVSIDDPAACIIGSCRKVSAGDSWAMNGTRVPYLICSVAQVAGSATVFTEAI